MDDYTYQDLCTKFVAYNRRLIRLRSDRSTKKITLCETYIRKIAKEILDAGRTLPTVEDGMPRKYNKQNPRPSLLRPAPKYFAVLTTGTKRRLLGPYAWHLMLHNHLTEMMLKARATGKYRVQKEVVWTVDLTDPELATATKYADADYFNSEPQQELTMEELQSRMRNE